MGYIYLIIRQNYLNLFSVSGFHSSAQRRVVFEAQYILSGKTSYKKMPALKESRLF